MKTIYVTVAVLIVVGAAGLYAFQQPPTVTITPATPSTVYVNSTTTVIISAQITDSRVINTGVNLLQVDPATGAQTIAGRLASQGGGIFDITIQPNTSQPQLLTYEVSAAFLGLLKRSISLPTTVAVAPVGVILPPDPGPAGMQTLAGIDSDGDGVRDDVQRWIAVTYASSVKIQSALTQYVKSLQALLTATSSQQSWPDMVQVLRAQYCANYTEFLLHSEDYSYKAALARMLNTYPRAQAFYAADAASSGHFPSVPQAGQELGTCDVNPNSLPN